MAEETQIILSVNTVDIARGESALDGLTAAGARAESAAKGLESGFARTGVAVGSAAAAIRQVAEGTGSASAKITESLGRTSAASRALALDIEKVGTSLGASGFAGAERIDRYGDAITKLAYEAKFASAELDGIGTLAQKTANKAAIAEKEVNDLARAMAGLNAGGGLGGVVKSGDLAAQSLARTSTASKTLSTDLHAVSTSLGATGFAGLAELDRLGTALGASSGAARTLAGNLKTIDTSALTLAGTSLGAMQLQARSAAASVVSVGTAGVAAGQGLATGSKGATEAAKNFNMVGLSAGQARMAMQTLPAQITDVFTSLAGGQSPLLVLIQQGGQLRDVFGGVGNVFRGLASIFTPIRLAIGGVVGVLAGAVLAFEAGADESRTFTRTLITTGNAAGVTAGQLSEMSLAVKNLGAGTQGQAASFINGLIASARIGSDSYEKLTAAALRYENAGGAAADETAKKFADLAKAPLEASIKLNEAENFLTASTYETIKALTEQGKVTEAARVAVDAYANVITQRAPEIEKSLGFIERFWRDIKKATREAGDEIAKIGRPSGPQEQLADAQARLANARQSANSFSGRLGGGSDQRVKDEEENVRLLSRRIVLEGEAAAAAAVQTKQVKDVVTFREKEGQYLSNALRVGKEIEKVRAEGLAAGPEFAKQTEARIAFLRQSIDSGAAQAALNKAEEASLEGVARALDDINTLRATGRMSEREQLEKSTELEVQALQIRKKGVEGDLKLAKGRINSEREVESLKVQSAQLDQQITTAQVKGRNAVTRALYSQAKAIESVLAAQRGEIADEISDYALKASKAREQLGIAISATATALEEESAQLRIEQGLIGATTAQREQELAYYRIKLDLNKQLAAINSTDFVNGEADRELERERARANAAKARTNSDLRVQVDNAKTVADAIIRENERAAERSADQINQAFTDALQRGFESGGKFGETFAKSLGASIKTQVIRSITDALKNNFKISDLGSLFSAVSSVFNGQGPNSSQSPGALQAAQQLASLYSSGTKAFGAASKFFGMGGSAAATYAPATNAALAESAVGAAGYGASSAGAGGAASASGFGSIGFTGYLALAVAALKKGSSEYDRGFTPASAREGKNSILGGDAVGRSFSSVSVDSLLTKFGQKLGMSEKWASIFSGETAIAQLIGKGTRRKIAGGFEGTVTQGDFTGNAYTENKEQRGFFRGGSRIVKTTDALDAPLENFLSEGAKALFTQAKKYGEALGLPVESLSSVSQQIKVSLFATEEENERAIKAVFDNYGKALVAGFEDAVKPLAKFGETVTQTIERVAGAILGVNEVFKSLGFAALASSVDGGKAAVAITDAFGGLDNLQAAAGTYFNEFFSETEKAAKATEKLTQAFSEVGLTLPKTRAEYRALVDAAAKDTTDAGQKQLVALLQLSGAFADLVPVTNELAASASSARETLAQLAKETVNLQVELLKAQGNPAGALKMQREADLKEIAGPDLPATERAAVIAAYDYNAALRLQIDAVKAATEASDQARRAGIDALRGLESGLASVLGGLARSIQETLADLIASQRALSDYRKGLRTSIADAALGTLGGPERVASLRKTEADLFTQLGTADDPVAIAQRLQQVILDRIREEASITEKVRASQIQTLRTQLDGYERLRGLARELAQFTGALRSSEMSPLSFEEQLAASRTLFEKSLAGAQSGDVFSQQNLASNARAYLEEQRAFSGSGVDYAEVFARVTASLDAFGGANNDPQIAQLEAQLEALNRLNEGQGQLIANNQQAVDRFTAIDVALQSRDDELQIKVADQTIKAQQQIEEQRAINVKLAEQLLLAKIGYETLHADLERIGIDINTIKTTGQMGTLAPEVRT